MTSEPPHGRYPYQHLWPDTARVPLLGFAAWSGTGKTTLLRRVIPLLRADGLRLALIKHAHHAFDVDTPGKDSHTLRKAGADQVLVTSDQRWALMVERAPEHVLSLREEIARLDQDSADLVLVEGFRHEHFPKLELLRPTGDEREPLHVQDASIVAVAAPGGMSTTDALPRLPLDEPEGVAAFIRDRVAAPL